MGEFQLSSPSSSSANERTDFFSAFFFFSLLSEAGPFATSLSASLFLLEGFLNRIRPSDGGSSSLEPVKVLSLNQRLAGEGIKKRKITERYRYLVAKIFA
jgi:hypothetical protein